VLRAGPILRPFICSNTEYRSDDPLTNETYLETRKGLKYTVQHLESSKLIH